MHFRTLRKIWEQLRHGLLTLDWSVQLKHFFLHFSMSDAQICGMQNCSFCKICFMQCNNAWLHSILIITTHVSMHCTVWINEYQDIRYYRVFAVGFSVFSVCQLPTSVSVSVFFKISNIGSVFRYTDPWLVQTVPAIDIFILIRLNWLLYSLNAKIITFDDKSYTALDLSIRPNEYVIHKNSSLEVCTLTLRQLSFAVCCVYLSGKLMYFLSYNY